jgi:hypothetical protein
MSDIPLRSQLAAACRFISAIACAALGSAYVAIPAGAAFGVTVGTQYIVVAGR